MTPSASVAVAASERTRGGKLDLDRVRLDFPAL